MSPRTKCQINSQLSHFCAKMGQMGQSIKSIIFIFLTIRDSIIYAYGQNILRHVFMIL